MKAKLKKSLSLLLALVMALSVMSVGAFAASSATIVLTPDGVYGTIDGDILKKPYMDTNFSQHMYKFTLSMSDKSSATYSFDSSTEIPTTTKMATPGARVRNTTFTVYVPFDEVSSYQGKTVTIVAKSGTTEVARRTLTLNVTDDELTPATALFKGANSVTVQSGQSSTASFTITKGTAKFKIGDESIISVEASQSGTSGTVTITGLKAGKTTLSIVDDQDNVLQSYGYDATLSVTVKESIPVSAVYLNYIADTRMVGLELPYAVQIKPVNATNQMVVFSSSDPTVAEIYTEPAEKESSNPSQYNEQQVWARTLKAGTTTISVAAQDGSGKTASFILTVVDPEPETFGGKTDAAIEETLKSSEENTSTTWTNTSDVNDTKTYVAYKTTDAATGGANTVKFSIAPAATATSTTAGTVTDTNDYATKASTANKIAVDNVNIDKYLADNTVADNAELTLELAMELKVSEEKAVKFNITPKLGGEKLADEYLTGSIPVKIPVPGTWDAAQVIHYQEDGTTVKETIAAEIETVDGVKYASFTTTSFTDFEAVEVAQAEPELNLRTVSGILGDAFLMVFKFNGSENMSDYTFKVYKDAACTEEVTQATDEATIGKERNPAFRTELSGANSLGNANNTVIGEQWVYVKVFMKYLNQQYYVKAFKDGEAVTFSNTLTGENHDSYGYSFMDYTAKISTTNDTWKALYDSLVGFNAALAPLV